MLAEARNMGKAYGIPEHCYHAVIFRAVARDASREQNREEAAAKWQKVVQMIDEKTPKLSFVMMGELCMEAGNKMLAIKAIRREKKPEIKIEALIEIEAW